MKCFTCNCRSYVLYIDGNHNQVCDFCYAMKTLDQKQIETKVKKYMGAFADKMSG